MCTKSSGGSRISRKGGGMDPLGGGCGPLTQVLFSENVCKNEGIWSCRGCVPGTPPRSANEKGSCTMLFACRSLVDICQLKLAHNQWRIQDFPLGGAPTRWGGANLRRIHFLAKTYVKTKEIDPVGGRAPRRPPGSANDNQPLLNFN